MELDPALPGTSGVMRRVTARDLCRRGADLLDEVELEGHRLMVTRNGRPVAIVGPVADNPGARRLARFSRRRGPPPTQAPPSANDPADTDELAELELDALDREILLEIAGKGSQRWMPNPQSSDDRKRLYPVLLRLEMEGLALKVFGGYRITTRGARLACRLPGKEPVNSHPAEIGES